MFKKELAVIFCAINGLLVFYIVVLTYKCDVCFVKSKIGNGVVPCFKKVLLLHTLSLMLEALKIWVMFVWFLSYFV